MMTDRTYSFDHSMLCLRENVASAACFNRSSSVSALTVLTANEINCTQRQTRPASTDLIQWERSVELGRGVPGCLNGGFIYWLQSRWRQSCWS